MATESMGNPNASYFKQGVFWKKIGNIPATELGTVKTYPHGGGIFWDADQAATYSFTQSGQARRKIILNMTGGEDLFLELFDDKGIVEENTAHNAVLAKREISFANLGPGNYVVRVRAGNTTQEKSASYRLEIQ
jgi:hypothetical protein